MKNIFQIINNKIVLFLYIFGLINSIALYKDLTTTVILIHKFIIKK